MGSKALKGSSISIISASVAIALTSPILCCWPPLNSDGYLSKNSFGLRPTIFISSMVDFSISSYDFSFFNLGISSIFSLIVKCGNNPILWITYPIFLLNFIGSSFDIGLSSIYISPLVGDINLFINFKVVVLPHPLGPINTTKLPSSIFKEISSRITLFPTFFDIFFISIIISPLLNTPY